MNQEQIIKNYEERIKNLETEIRYILDTLSQHTHNGNDGSKRYKYVIPPEQDVQVGSAFIDSLELKNASTNAISGYSGYFLVGKENPDLRFGDPRSFPSTQLEVQHQEETNGTTNQTFFFALRPPIYTQTNIGVTSGASTLTDSIRNWTTDELAGALVEIFNSSGSQVMTRQIASNTSTEITIDGTWASTVSGGFYTVYMPVYLGSADTPWRQLYAGGDDVTSGGTGAQRRAIRMGYGTTGGTETIGVFFGTGSPESVVTANVGSLFLRTDGGATTTLYVKTSGSSNTGWTAK